LKHGQYIRNTFAIITACATLLVGAALTSAAPPTTERTIQLPAGPGPLDNPLKGWCTYTFAGQLHQPYSFVYRYVTWKELEPTEGNYQFAQWEKKAWDDPMSKGKPVVIRVDIDYPGSPSGIPDWLLAKGLKTRHYTDYGGGNSPDYDNPDLVDGLEKLIAAMGQRYDHNPRVAFVALGLLGFWGEWHTYPHTDWFASDATQQRIVDAYHKAFPDKILVARYAKGYLGQQDWIGYHDDMFPSDTDSGQDWMFLPQIRASGRTENWRHAVVGGEMEPQAANKWLGDGFATTMHALETGHFTWVGPYNPGMEPNQTPQFVERSQEMVRRMGYQYCLQQIQYTPEIVNGGLLKVAITAENQGVAPFYYNWPVKLALISSDGAVAATLPLDADIRTWQPGAFTITASQDVRTNPGTYQLAIGIFDPLTGQPDIRFANNLPVKNGWTILTNVKIVR